MPPSNSKKPVNKTISNVVSAPKVKIPENPYAWSTNWFVELDKAGFSREAQKNILFQIQAESTGKNISEKHNGNDRVAYFEKKMGYKTATGKGLGNTQEGDGARYAGQGFIQLTGRENYRRVGALIGEDLENHPELMKDDSIAMKASIAYLKSRGERNKANFEKPEDVHKVIASGKEKEYRQRLERVNLSGITVPSDKDINYNLPAEDEKLRSAYVAGTITDKEYYSKRGF